jgi:glycosyltransferase 2 family protein
MFKIFVTNRELLFKNLSKNLTNIIGKGFLLFSIYFVAKTFYEYSNQLQLTTFSAEFILSSCCGILILLTHVVINGKIWQLLLANSTTPLNYLTCFKIVATTQIGKYLPGNIGHVIGKIGMSKKYGVAIANSGTALLLESTLVISVALVIASPIIYSNLNLIISSAKISISILFIGLICIPTIIYLIANRNDSNTNLINIIKILLLYFICLTSAGFSLFILALIQGLPCTFSNLFFIISGFSGAWVLGFITPGSPGGIGIREFIFILLCGKLLGEGQASIIITIFRFQSIISEIILFLYARTIKTEN